MDVRPGVASDRWSFVVDFGGGDIITGNTYCGYTELQPPDPPRVFTGNIDAC